MPILQVTISKYIKKTRKGLTFLEILVVIFIFSVLLSVVIPTVINNASTDLEKAAGQLSALIETLQFDAFINNQTLLLEFDTEELFYQIYYTDAKKHEWIKHPDYETLPLVENIEFDEIDTVSKGNLNEKEGVVIRSNSFIETFSVTFVNQDDEKIQFKMLDVMGEKKILYDEDL